jgi:hypothetical protein
VPFAFLEAGYLFYYTVFARRHAEFLERAINAQLGRAALVAHRLEAAYFNDPAAPKLAFFSFARPSSFTSAMTVGYSIGALVLWVSGIKGSLGVTGYLLWHFLGRRDEERLLAELRAFYGDGVGSPKRQRRSR